MKKPHKMIVACTNASGEADIFTCAVDVTNDEIDLGVHYDAAKHAAADAGYESPFLCYDEFEAKNIVRALSPAHSAFAPEARVHVDLNHCDEDGIVVDTSTMELTMEQISDVIDHAAQLLVVFRSMGARKNTIHDFTHVLAELENALVVANIISSTEAPLPCLAQCE